MRRRLLACMAVVGMLLAACTVGGGTSRTPPASPSGPWYGGTLRMVGGLWPYRLIDPRQLGYGGVHWELYRCCLLRTLLSYNGHPATEGGSELRPDLASSIPSVSDDGLTWTFHLKTGLRYGPPYDDTEIVAQDVVRALERMSDPNLPASNFAPYFSMIEGFDQFREGRVSSIAGLETPNDHTLVVHLTEPTGDLGYRFTIPATAPIPPGATDGHPTDYFPFLVSSGPYMIEGSGDLDFSVPPKHQKPVSGLILPKRHDDGTFDTGSMTLVRNPSWGRKTDQLRHAFVDQIDIELWPLEEFGDKPRTQRVLARRVDAGEIDYPPEVDPGLIERYLSDPQLRDRVVQVPYSDITYMPMSLAVRPFDDVHVRRAVNLAIDKAAIVRRFDEAVGGNEGMTPISHVIPDGLEGALLPAGWRPDWAEGVGDAGDLEAARREMALSRYDDDGDGRCDHLACRRIEVVVETEGYEFDYSWWWEHVRDDLRAIGLRLVPRVLPCVEALERIATPAAHVALSLSICNGWAPDYPNGSSWIPILSGPAASWNLDQALLGATPEQLRDWGYEITDVPSIDDRIDHCMALVGLAHTQCWVALDQFLSQEIVPWVPVNTSFRTYVVSDRVAYLEYDTYGRRPALDQIALVPGSE